jgi:threonine synthase
MTSVPDLTRLMHLICPRCGREGNEGWRCPCGALRELSGSGAAEEASAPRSLLGEGSTPLLEERSGAGTLLVKAEYRNPTGSFKDRGSAAVVAAALRTGATALVSDSSGNAALSLAAHAARASLPLEVFVPEVCNPWILQRLEELGARVIAVPGHRSAASEKAEARAGEPDGPWDAGHARNPWFLVGTGSIAGELIDQLEGRAPGVLVLPVGNGTLLLGAHRAFLRMVESGRVSTLPRIVAVQTEACAPLVAAWRGEEAPPPEPTVARGLAVDQPARGPEIIAAVRESEGLFLSVREDELVEGTAALRARGHIVDPCAGAAWAGALRARETLGDEGDWVVTLTGLQR